MKTLFCVFTMTALFISTSYATEFNCTAQGKLHSVPLAKLNGIYKGKVEGIDMAAQERNGFLVLSVGYEDMNVGATTEVSIASMNDNSSANLALNFVNGSPTLKCRKL